MDLFCTEGKKEWWTIMKKWWGCNSFFTKIHLSLLLLERSETDVSVRDRWKTGKWRIWTQTGRGLLYWPFLNQCYDSIFRPLYLWFLDERFSTIGPPWAAAPPTGSHPDLVVTVTDYECHEYLGIYNFIMPIHSTSTNVICFWLSTHVSCPPVYTARTSCPRNP